jgi:hypothetical protein
MYYVLGALEEEEEVRDGWMVLACNSRMIDGAGRRQYDNE